MDGGEEVVGSEGSHYTCGVPDTRPLTFQRVGASGAWVESWEVSGTVYPGIFDWYGSVHPRFVTGMVAHRRPDLSSGTQMSS